MSDIRSTKANIAYKAKSLPQPIPAAVLYQLDVLLAQAIQIMESGQIPGILKPVHWDAILILRRTGMRFEELIHLREPDSQGHNGCLKQDSEGYWWLHIRRKMNKIDKEYRIPLERCEGVVEAIYRQQERAKSISDHMKEGYLFRSQRGALRYTSFRDALVRDLAPHLTYDGQLYPIKPSQFRRTRVIEMLEQGADIYTVKELLGYASLSAMDKYTHYQIANQMLHYNDVLHVKDWGFCGNPLASNSCFHRPFLPHYCACSDAQQTMKPYLHMSRGETEKHLLIIETLRKKPDSQRTNQEQIPKLQDTKQATEAIQREECEDGSPDDCQAN